MVRALGTCLLLLLLSTFTPVINLVAGAVGLDATPAPADAIVVLAAGVQPDLTLNARSLARFFRGTLLFRQDLAPIIVYSGTPDEAALRRELAEQLGVPRRAILTEDRSHTTRDEAALIAGRLRERSVRRILLVTSSLHLGRAAGLFEQAGLDVIPVSADVQSMASGRPEGRIALARDLAQELAARLYYRIAGYI